MDTVHQHAHHQNPHHAPRTVVKKGNVRNSLRFSLWDGVFASIQFGLVEQFITPFALFLGAGSRAIGLLNFIRSAFVSIVQIYSADVTLRLKSRKKLLTFCVFMAAALWIPTFFFPIFFKSSGVLIFILLFSITSSFNVFATPAWSSLVAEYLPPRKRGAYFGWRRSILGVIYFLSILAGGFILHYFYSFNLILGFSLIFIAASVSRFISWFFLTRMYEPKWQVHSTHYFSFLDFLKRFPQGNFVKFAVFSSFFMLAVSISSPFLPVYLLSELKFDYVSYTFIMGAAVLSTFVMQRRWGSFGDRHGNVKVIEISALLITVIPLLWILSKNVFYLILIQLFGGFLWAGFNLSSSNFIHDVAMSNKRERCIAYYNFLVGVGLGLGALAGGFLYKILPAFHGSVFFALFLISAILRFIASLLIILFTKEVRQVEHVRNYMLLLDISGVRSLGLLSRELLFRQSKKV